MRIRLLHLGEPRDSERRECDTLQREENEVEVGRCGNTVAEPAQDDKAREEGEPVLGEVKLEGRVDAVAADKFFVKAAQERDEHGRHKGHVVKNC